MSESRACPYCGASIPDRDWTWRLRCGRCGKTIQTIAEREENRAKESGK